MAVSYHDLSFPSRTGEQIKTKVHDLSAAYKDIVDLVKPSGAGTEVLVEFPLFFFKMWNVMKKKHCVHLPHLSKKKERAPKCPSKAYESTRAG